MLLLGDCGHALIMALRLDPRGDLPPPMMHHTPYGPRPFSKYHDHDSRRRSVQLLQKPSRRLCHDWIFSSSTNVHIAIDRPAFKTYIPFSSYVLSLADQRKIEVKGIGSVELKVRCKPGSKAEHTILLQNVLHVPTWLCNIFSDIYFTPAQDFEHTWTESGVNFIIRDQDRLRHWGYTEGFCGLDRLVLGRKHDGRSPMQDDREREIFSINVTWPKSQRDKWETYAAMQLRMEANAHEILVTQKDGGSQSKMRRHLSEQNFRQHHGDTSTKTSPLTKPHNRKISALRATVSSLSLARAAAPR